MVSNTWLWTCWNRFWTKTCHFGIPLFKEWVSGWWRYQRLFEVWTPRGIGEIIFQRIEELEFEGVAPIHHLNLIFIETATVDGSEIRLTSWGEGSLSHYWQGFRVVVWDSWTINSIVRNIRKRKRLPQPWEPTVSSPFLGVIISPISWGFKIASFFMVLLGSKREQ